VQKLRAAARTGELADIIDNSNAMQTHYPNNTFGIFDAFSNVAKNVHLDVLLYLCEN